jgi:dUTP pyrophosphatase
MQVKIKKLNPKAIVPAYAKSGDAGLDLTAVSVEYNVENNFVECGTGLAVEIPSGYVGLVFSRSSVSKKNLILANGVGVIDAGYRGEIRLRFKPCSNVAQASGNEANSNEASSGEISSSKASSNEVNSNEASNSKTNSTSNVAQTTTNNTFAVGERVGQMIILPYPIIELVEVPELSNTDRGSGGYGSTGQ